MRSRRDVNRVSALTSGPRSGSGGAISLFWGSELLDGIPGDKDYRELRTLAFCLGSSASVFRDSSIPTLEAETMIRPQGSWLVWRIGDQHTPCREEGAIAGFGRERDPVDCVAICCFIGGPCHAAR